MMEFFAAILMGVLSLGDSHQISPAICDAIMMVESGGNPNAVGDRGNAVGAYQIWPVMVKDVNRILKRNQYSLQDRFSREKSREMFIIYSMHYANHTKDWSPEGIARRWVGGPKGHLKSGSAKYWEKVKKELGRPQTSLRKECE